MSTRNRSVRLFSSILALILLFQLVACGESGTNSTDNSVPVVVFSDIHFNPFYDPSLFEALDASDVGQWERIFRTSGIKAPSTWGEDTNYPLLALALSNIGQNRGASPLIIFTGDILGHGLPLQYYEKSKRSPFNEADVAAMKVFLRKTVAFVLQQVRASVGDIPVMFVLGNADSYADILPPDSSFFSDTAELYYTEFLGVAADHQTFIADFTNGGYYAAEPPGMNVMVIGLNTYEFSPLFNDKYAEAVKAQITWLDSTLSSARAKGKKVWLLMHVPPGADIATTAKSVDAGGHITSASMMWQEGYQTSFLHTLSKYPGLITQTFTAHTHMDEYRIISSSNLADTTPSIAPYFGNNPAFKVFTFSRDTLRATDYTSLNYDLATMPGEFNSYYTFSSAYLMRGFLSDSQRRLYPELATRDSKQQLYRRNYFSGHNNFDPVGSEVSPITDRTWPVYWCGIRHMDKRGLINCVNSY